MPDATPRQGRYLAYIHAYTEGFGIAPAESEIAAALGVAPPSANQMMKSLEKKGFIRRTPGVPRSIEILVPSSDLPKWKGKAITRTVREWTLIDPEARRSAKTDGRQTVIYRLKITLQHSDPEIWRRIETPDVTLETLHNLIQVSMGWTNSHLHEFVIAGKTYASSEVAMEDFDNDRLIDDSGIRLSDVIPERGAKPQIDYVYDFGDEWRHRIVLETVTESEPGIRYPRCCDGERNCPPEDIGGVIGFDEYLEAIADPKHDRYDEFLEWMGPFDPEQFDAVETTKRMRKWLR
jgi:DNA-binding transcriptional regulator YdaS (Cro superfamily)